MQIFDKEVPAAWLGVLANIQRVFPEAVLAGGCLRDLVLGGEVKDLDVFVPFKAEHVELDATPWFIPGSGEHMTTLARNSGWGIGKVIQGGYGSLGTEARLCQEFHVHGIVPTVQVIHMDMPEFRPMAVLERMDFGACQIGLVGETPDGDDGLYYTMEAAYDILDRRITLLRVDNPDNVARSVRRGVRFSAKYAGTDVTVDLSRASSMFADINDVRTA